MILEPGFAQAASIFGLGDALAIGVQLDIVTDAAAKGAGGVFDHGQAHAFLPCSLLAPSEPDGMTNVQPSSLPRQLPRMRRGLYRPVSSASQAGGISGSAAAGIGKKPSGSLAALMTLSLRFQ